MAEDLRRAVLAELEWDPAVDTSRVRVVVRGARVMLTGVVNSYAEKCRVVRSVRAIRGVDEIVDDLSVEILDEDRCSDALLLETVRVALRLNVLVASSIEVRVEAGWVTLLGTVAARYQRDEAERTVGRVRGVRGLTSDVSVTPFESRTALVDPAPGITAAIRRRRDVRADDVTIVANGQIVTVAGIVESDLQRAAVLETAWKAPCVVGVVDRLGVRDPAGRPAAPESDSPADRPSLRACGRLGRLAEQLRADVDRVSETRTRILFVTTADLLLALREAFTDADARESIGD